MKDFITSKTVSKPSNQLNIYTVMAENKIKITYGDTEYELDHDPFMLHGSTMEFIINGTRFTAKAITKESTIPDKPKVPLFTCFDGSENFIGDYVYIVRKEDYCIAEPFTTSGDMKDLSTMNTDWLYFSSEEKRNEWVLSNKPIQVSYKELCDLLPFSYISTKQALMKIFKSKINL